jgi:phage major head subunit gpT-like protein
MGAGVLNSANLLATKKEMLEVKNEAGKTLRVNPNLIIAGPENLSNLVLAIDNQLAANGESNSTYKMFTYIILPEITGTEWYMLDVSKPIRPFILQIAEDVSFEASDDNKFMKDAALFGAKTFMNAGYGLWQLAYKRSGVA